MQMRAPMFVKMAKEFCVSICHHLLWKKQTSRAFWDRLEYRSTISEGQLVSGLVKILGK